MNLKAFGIALTALTLAACSSQPTQPTAANVAAPALAAAPAASKPAAEPVPVAVSADGKPPALNRAIIQGGYKATTIKGEVYYCRQEDVIGTNFKKKVCLNEEQMKVQEERMKVMQDEMNRTKTNPACFAQHC
jgi:glucose/arabinose dehydrogenase